MKKANNFTILPFSILILLLQLSQFVLNFGLVVASTEIISTLNLTALTVGIFALGSFAALVFSQKISFLLIPNTKLDLFIFGSISALSGVLITLTTFSPLFFILIFVYASATSLLFSRLMSLTATYTKTDRLLTATKLQLFSSIGIVLGVGLGPLLSAYFTVQHLLYSVFIFNLISLVLFFFVQPMTIEPRPIVKEDSLNFYDLFYSAEIKFVFFSILCVWLTGGFFSILEVPILKKILLVQPYIISLVFILTTLASLLAVSVMAKASINNTMTTIKISTSACILCALAYIYTSQINFIYLIVLIYGFANGTFNIAQTVAIQKISHDDLRTTGFLTSRFLTQIMLLIAALLTLSGSLDEHISLVSKICIIVFSFYLFAYFIFSKNLKQISVVLFLIFSTSINAQNSINNNQVIRIAIPSLPGEIDPNKINELATALIAGQIFDTLYEYNDKNVLVPKLIISQIWKNDGRTLEVTVDTSKTFSDGSVLDSYSIRESIIQSMQHLKGNIRWALGELKGFNSAVSAKSKKIVDFPGIEILSESKLAFHLERPFGLLAHMLSIPNLMIKKKAKDGTLLGTGFYAFKDRTPTTISLIARKDLKSEYAPAEVDFVLDSSDKINPNIDIYSTQQLPKDIPKEYYVKPYDYLQTILLILNTESTKFLTSSERCAFIHKFQSAIKGSKYEWAPIEIGIPLSWEMTTANTNAIKNNVTSLRGKYNIKFANSTARFLDTHNEGIRSTLLKSGVEVSFKKFKPIDLIKDLHKRNFDVAMIGFVPDYLHLDALLYPQLYSKQQYNFSGLNKPEVDQLLNQARKAVTKEDQNRLYGKVLDSLKTECPISFLGSQKASLIVRSNLKIKNFNSLGFHHMKVMDIRSQ